MIALGDLRLERRCDALVCSSLWMLKDVMTSRHRNRRANHGYATGATADEAGNHQIGGEFLAGVNGSAQGPTGAEMPRHKRRRIGAKAF